MQIVDKSDPTRVLGELTAARVASLQRIHAGAASDRDRLIAQAAIRETRQFEAWLRCPCTAEGPLLAPARLGVTHYLRRLSSRAPHAPGCPFWDAASWSEERDHNERRTRPSVHDSCRPLTRSLNLENQWTSSRDAPRARNAPALALQLWRLLERGRINRVGSDPTDGIDPTLTAQLAAIRNAARGIRVGADVRLADVLSTYPGDIAPRSPWHTKSLAAHPRFRNTEQPQALMIGLARSVQGRSLSTVAGDISCEIDIAFASMTARSAGPPFLFMLVGAIAPDQDRITPIRAFAQPVLSANRLIPVESASERLLLMAALAFRRGATLRFPSLRIGIEKPLFDIETPRGLIRPPLLFTISNQRIGTEESFVLQLEQAHRTRNGEADDAFGRTLVIPDLVLHAEPAVQADWFIDAIYGAASTGAAHRPQSLRRAEHVAPSR